MRWPQWKKRTRRPEQVAIRLRNGKTAWVYPGERIIDMTEKGMEPQFDIYVSGTYMGRASWATCKALRDSESERPDRVHGVVLEDSDPPRLVLNPLHDESPALVRRVVEAMSAESAGPQKDSLTMAINVYVNSQFIAVSENDDLEWWSNAILSAGLRYDEVCLKINGPVTADLEINSGFGSDIPALVAVAAALASVEQANTPRDLKDAARAFEKAINAEQGIEVKVVPTGAHDIHAAVKHTKWAVRVTRSKQEQVYP